MKEIIALGGRLDQTKADLNYLCGFENTHSTQAVEGAV